MLQSPFYLRDRPICHEIRFQVFFLLKPYAYVLSGPDWAIQFGD